MIEAFSEHFQFVMQKEKRYPEHGRKEKKCTASPL